MSPNPTTDRPPSTEHPEHPHHHGMTPAHPSRSRRVWMAFALLLLLLPVFILVVAVLTGHY